MADELVFFISIISVFGSPQYTEARPVEGVTEIATSPSTAAEGNGSYYSKAFVSTNSLICLVGLSSLRLTIMQSSCEFIQF